MRFEVNLPLSGDIAVNLQHLQLLPRKRKRNVFRCSFHSGYVHGNSLLFPLSELDTSSGSKVSVLNVHDFLLYRITEYSTNLMVLFNDYVMFPSFHRFSMNLPSYLGLDPGERHRPRSALRVKMCCDAASTTIRSSAFTACSPQNACTSPSRSAYGKHRLKSMTGSSAFSGLASARRTRGWWDARRGA